MFDPVTIGISGATGLLGGLFGDDDAPPTPPPQNTAKEIKDYVKGYDRAMPSVLDFEKKYRGKFQNLNQGEISSFLRGKNGIFDLARNSANVAGNILRNQSRQELKGFNNLSGLTRRLMDNLSPEAASQVRGATQYADTARQNAQGLTGQEARDAVQFARESSSDRGRVMDNSSIFGEALNRDSLLTAKRAEASQATNNAFGLAQSFYQMPGLQQLNSTPQSYGAGQGLLGIGLNSIGSSKPQLINPDKGIDIASANRQNQINASSAAAQSSASQNAGMMNSGASIFSSLLKSFGE